jgi:hypothetical protein
MTRRRLPQRTAFDEQENATRKSAGVCLAGYVRAHVTNTKTFGDSP